jgi:hypothetical protein
MHGVCLHTLCLHTLLCVCTQGCVSAHRAVCLHTGLCVCTPCVCTRRANARLCIARSDCAATQVACRASHCRSEFVVCRPTDEASARPPPLPGAGESHLAAGGRGGPAEERLAGVAVPLWLADAGGPACAQLWRRGPRVLAGDNRPLTAAPWRPRAEGSGAGPAASPQDCWKWKTSPRRPAADLWVRCCGGNRERFFPQGRAPLGGAPACSSWAAAAGAPGARDPRPAALAPLVAAALQAALLHCPRLAPALPCFLEAPPGPAPEAARAGAAGSCSAPAPARELSLLEAVAAELGARLRTAAWVLPESPASGAPALAPPTVLLRPPGVPPEVLSSEELRAATGQVPPPPPPPAPRAPPRAPAP